MLCVYAFYETWCEDRASGTELAKELNALPAWGRAVDILHREAQRIVALHEAVGLPVPYIESRLLDPILFDTNAEEILARHGLPTTPGTQKYLIAKALSKIDPSRQTEDKPTRGVKVQSICLAPLALQTAKLSDRKEATSQLHPTVRRSLEASLTGDVVTQVIASSQWDGDAWRDVPDAVKAQRELWRAEGNAAIAGDLRRHNRGETSLFSVPGVREKMLSAMKEKQFEPKTDERQAILDEIYALHDAANGGQKVDRRPLRNKIEGQERRWKRDGLPFK